MTGLAIGLALLFALAAVGWRVLRRIRLARRLAALPGGSLDTAMVVTSFVDIEEEVARRRCLCGGRLSRASGTAVATVWRPSNAKCASVARASIST